MMMEDANESADRVSRYIDRLRKSSQHDQERIHAFDIGEPSAAELFVSDLRILCAQVRNGGGSDNNALADAVHRFFEINDEFTRRSSLGVARAIEQMAGARGKTDAELRVDGVNAMQDMRSAMLAARGGK